MEFVILSFPEKVTINQTNRLELRNIVAMDLPILTKAKHHSMAYKYGP